MSQTLALIAPARYPRVRTSIVLSVSAWAWLKQKALDDAARVGGKPSASAVLEQLVRDEAERDGK